MFFSVVKKFSFEASHRLYNLPNSACSNFHGHSYHVDIEIASEQLNEFGMIVDFSKLKETFGTWLQDNYDHAMIFGDTDPFIQTFNKENSKFLVMKGMPTAENMAYTFAMKVDEIITNEFNFDPIYIKIRVAETEKNIASYTLNYKVDNVYNSVHGEEIIQG